MRIVIIMKKGNTVLSFILLSLYFISCERVKQKAGELKEKGEDKAMEKIEYHTQRVINKAFPPFDHNTPDTENNKSRFSDFLKVDLTSDIKNIYCFEDAIGADADYMFSFNCDSSTSNKIIETHRLKIDSVNKDNGFGMQNDFEWWDKAQISKLPKYSWTDGNQYHKYYWYDKLSQKAYFFDFDM